MIYRLSAFRNRVLEVNNALSEILTNDDDMSEMYLTTKATIGHRRRRNQHDEVEMLFENYFKQVQDILYQVQDLQSSVRAVEEMINMRLDAYVFLNVRFESLLVEFFRTLLVCTYGWVVVLL